MFLHIIEYYVRDYSRKANCLLRRLLTIALDNFRRLIKTVPWRIWEVCVSFLLGFLHILSFVHSSIGKPDCITSSWSELRMGNSWFQLRGGIWSQLCMIISWSGRALIGATCSEIQLSKLVLQHFAAGGANCGLFVGLFRLKFGGLINIWRSESELQQLLVVVGGGGGVWTLLYCSSKYNSLDKEKHYLCFLSEDNCIDAVFYVNRFCAGHFCHTLVNAV